MKNIWFILLLFLSCYSVGTISGVPESTEEALQDGIFTITMHKDSMNFDPVFAYTATESQFYTACYEGLVTFHPFSLEPIPGVARDWDVSEDGRVYKFYIRNDAYFNNGDPLLAGDFRDSWLRLIDPSKKAEYSSYFDIIKGVAEYRKGGLNAESVGIRVLGDKVLEVELENPASYFLKLLCHMSFVPIHSSYINKTGWGKNSKKLITNGPYSYFAKSADEILFVKNNFYWGNRQVEIEQVRVIMTEDLDAVTEDFNLSRVHWAMDWVEDTLIDKEAVVANPILGTTFLFFKCRSAPWDNKDIRLGLSLLLPWDELRPVILNLKADTLIPPFPGYARAEGLVQDVERGLALLEEAGYPRGKGLAPINIKLIQGNFNRLLGETLKNVWEEQLEVQVNIREIPFSGFFEELDKDDYTIGLMTWIADYADPLSFLLMWESSSNLNDAGFSSSEYDTLMAEAMSREGDEKFDRLLQGEKMLLESAVILPLRYFYSFNLVNHNIIGGWFPNLLDIHPFKFFYFKENEVVPGLVMRNGKADRIF